MKVAELVPRLCLIWICLRIHFFPRVISVMLRSCDLFHELVGYLVPVKECYFLHRRMLCGRLRRLTSYAVALFYQLLEVSCITLSKAINLTARQHSLWGAAQDLSKTVLLFKGRWAERLLRDAPVTPLIRQNNRLVWRWSEVGISVTRSFVPNWQQWPWWRLW